MSDPQRYPLSWPDRWPRTNPANRVHARFEPKSISRAWNFLHAEMTRMGLSSWFMSSNIRRSVRDGSPISNPEKITDSGVAVYFQISGKPVSLACDKWLLVQDNMWALAKHIEALRGQDRWGVGTMEQAFRGYMALPGVGESSAFDWWTVLGVPVNADEALVKQAYRLLVKKHHPDRNGDAEMFHRVQKAYERFQESLSTSTNNTQ